MSSIAIQTRARLIQNTRVLRISLFAAIVLGQACAQDTQDSWQAERAHIERIAQFAAKEHAAILFTVYDQVGYASEGTVRKLDLPQSDSHCLLSLAFSRSGRYLAYVGRSGSRGCQILVLELATGKVRTMADPGAQPRDLSWSWDDSEIAFVDLQNSSASIQAVSSQDASVRALPPPSQLRIDPTASGDLFRFDNRSSLGWSHSGQDLFAGFDRDVPTKQANVYSTHPIEVRIQLAKGNAVAEIGDGYGAAVSPVADRIAWYQDNRIVTANIDGSDRQVLARAPRWMGIFPGDFKGPLVWAPDGNRLFFGTFESETCRDSVYLLSTRTKHATRFLSGTCIVILDWRSSQSAQK